MTQPQTIGFLGAGNMAEALIRGILKADLVAPANVFASDISEERLQLLRGQLGIQTTPKNEDVLRSADTIFLCVKPQQVDSVLSEMKSHFDAERHLLASIAAGVPTARMEKHLPEGSRVVRVMPNTPVLVGLGAACICGGQSTRKEDLDTVEALLSSASVVLQVKEPMMDAVTGLSGSGPAYLFYLVEAMVDAGTAEGFSREEASTLAIRTCLGAARMLEETGASPEELRRRVTSPNGTTQAALEQLEGHGVKALLTSAVRRAAERSRELGREG